MEIIQADRAPRVCKGFHETYALALITEGTRRVRYRRRIYEHHRGELLLLEPGETYAHMPAESALSGLVLHVAPRLFSPVALGAGSMHWRTVVTTHSRLNARLLAFVAALPSMDGIEAEEQLLELLGAFVAELAQPPLRPTEDRPPAGGLSRAREMLHARLLEGVTLDELVRAAGWTTKQRLILDFRAAFGFSPHEYLTQLRLQRARGLLRSGHGCGETAYAVGFYDQSQLNRHFVKHLGVTPGAYARAVI